MRGDADGILISQVSLGDTVRQGQVVAIIVNPMTNDVVDVFAPMDGTVLGHAQNQFVSPGFALFRIGQSSESPELEPKSPTESDDGDDP